MAVWEHFTNQKQWERYLKDLLQTNDVALLRAIVLIYDNQTDEEKYRGESVEDNRVGFSKWDAKELTSYALKIKQCRPLTEAELAISRNKMPKYWRQLMVISKRRMVERQQQRIERRNLLIHTAAQYEALRQCSEESIACDFGICSECELCNK